MNAELHRLAEKLQDAINASRDDRYHRAWPDILTSKLNELRAELDKQPISLCVDDCDTSAPTKQSECDKQHERRLVERGVQAGFKAAGRLHGFYGGPQGYACSCGETGTWESLEEHIRSYVKDVVDKTMKEKPEEWGR